MKRYLCIIALNVFLVFSCGGLKNSKQNPNMKEYKCSFNGDKNDVNNFLGGNSFINDIHLQVFANQYTFIHGESPLMMYTYDDKSKTLETFNLKKISTQLKSDRKYKMQVIDSTKNGFTMKIESGPAGFTEMKNTVLIIECISKN